MRVILVKPVRGLGKVGEVVDVKSGYARNFLLPREVAVRASSQNLANIEVERDAITKKNEDRALRAAAALKKVESDVVSFVVQAGSDGKLFGSVSARSIAAQIVALSDFHIDCSDVRLPMPIRYVGLHHVEVVYHADVVGRVPVIVGRSDAEIQALSAQSASLVSAEVVRAPDPKTPTAADTSPVKDATRSERNKK